MVLKVRHTPPTPLAKPRGVSKVQCGRHKGILDIFAANTARNVQRCLSGAFFEAASATSVGLRRRLHLSSRGAGSSGCSPFRPAAGSSVDYTHKGGPLSAAWLHEPSRAGDRPPTPGTFRLPMPSSVLTHSGCSSALKRAHSDLDQLAYNMVSLRLAGSSGAQQQQLQQGEAGGGAGGGADAAHDSLMLMSPPQACVLQSWSSCPI